ncbi:MAG: group 1 truncated hemoglobin [Rhodoferax sp.]|jgi:hemoglobin|nr:group 1 truncated hemoglobin [Rhodoferax sp.]
MKKSIIALTLVACSALAAPAFSQTTPLYKTFGEKPGLVKLMDDFMERLLADPRTGPHFKPADQKHVKAQLVDQICVAIGGPCVYKGADMKTSHSNLDITKSDFNALVEVLQLAMDAQGIAFGAQNQLLAKLAPMYRDVITVKD